MTTKHHGLKKTQLKENFYSEFDQLDGTHPWMEAVPEGYVTYKVRELQTGQVLYFNYALAKEMGLISLDHPHLMTPELEQKLIDTFALQIVNEFDEINQRRFDPKTIKANRYMATRYLQLQHHNKQGKTSGDGRGIWNGTFKHKGNTWDVSSRGTGVTCLAPGAVIAQKPLKTGGTEFGYGCGLAEIDELLGAAILAEIMHLQQFNTERVLCVIDLGKGYGIGVRASLNLTRPAHLFLYLKQEKWTSLKRATDYLIDRQIQNKKWKISSQAKKYDEMLSQVGSSFAKFAARLDANYVFAWLDWDGDNVLADAGIIDYGSVRQFGIRHDKYRYDDVERFSTNLNEQKQKARLMVQVFAQMVDYIKTKNKKPLKNFSKHPILKKFDKDFKQAHSHEIMYHLGFDKEQRNLIFSQKQILSRFEKEFHFFERAKISNQVVEVADGVNLPPLFNMKKIIKLLPHYLNKPLELQAFLTSCLSSFATSQDTKISSTYKTHLSQLVQSYKDMIHLAFVKPLSDKQLQSFYRKIESINSDKLITGNALIELVDLILSEKKRGLPALLIQNTIDRLVFERKDLPETDQGKVYRFEKPDPQVKIDLFSKINNLIEEHKEDI